MIILNNLLNNYDYINIVLNSLIIIIIIIILILIIMIIILDTHGESALISFVPKIKSVIKVMT